MTCTLSWTKSQANPPLTSPTAKTLLPPQNLIPQDPPLNLAPISKLLPLEWLGATAYLPKCIVWESQVKRGMIKVNRVMSLHMEVIWHMGLSRAHIHLLTPWLFPLSFLIFFSSTPFPYSQLELTHSFISFNSLPHSLYSTNKSHPSYQPMLLQTKWQQTQRQPTDHTMGDQAPCQKFTCFTSIFF